MSIFTLFPNICRKITCEQRPFDRSRWLKNDIKNEGQGAGNSRTLACQKPAEWIWSGKSSSHNLTFLCYLIDSYNRLEINKKGGWWFPQTTLRWVHDDTLWRWRWLPHRLLKRQSLSTTTVLFTTTVTLTKINLPTYDTISSLTSLI